MELELGLIEAMADWEIGRGLHRGAPGHWQQAFDLKESCRIYVPHKGERLLVATFHTPEFAAYAAMAVNERKARRELLISLQQPAWPRPTFQID